MRLVNNAGNLNVPLEERPVFLSGARPQTSQWRDELALLVVRSRPFARNFVNRLWYQLLGRGIVHPPDDFNQNNHPTIPPLLDLLTDSAIDSRFDTALLVQAICQSRAYQMTSARDRDDATRESLFAYRSLKPLTPEQLYDSVAVATGIVGTTQGRREYLNRFADDPSGTESAEPWRYRETAQTLMTRLARDIALPDGSLDDLFRRSIGRPPTEYERVLCRGRPSADLWFALLNGNEFFFNH